MSHWSEGKNIKLIPADIKNQRPAFALLTASNGTCFGVLIGPLLILDIDGDSILDIESNQMWMPYWIVKQSAIIDPRDSTVLNWFEEGYEQMLQADVGHLNDDLAKLYSQFRLDTTIANRHLFYLYDSYQTIVSTAENHKMSIPTELCLSIVDSLAEESNRIYGIIPAIVWIYKGEALLSAGLTEQARNHFRKGLELFPQSIPIQVYNFRLEKNERVRTKQYKTLKKKYPKHWMVRDI